MELVGHIEWSIYHVTILHFAISVDLLPVKNVSNLDGY